MTEEGSIPPVAPEVINIFLFQRNEKGMDTPSGHIIVFRVSDRGTFPYSIFSSCFRTAWMRCRSPGLLKRFLCAFVLHLLFPGHYREYYLKPG